MQNTKIIAGLPQTAQTHHCLWHDGYSDFRETRSTTWNVQHHTASVPIISDPTLKKLANPVSLSHFVLTNWFWNWMHVGFMTASLFENYTKRKKGLCHTSFLDCINYLAFSRRTKREKKEANTIAWHTLGPIWRRWRAKVTNAIILPTLSKFQMTAKPFFSLRQNLWKNNSWSTD